MKFEKVFLRWTDQEKDRFVQILIDRGFITQEASQNPDLLAQAHRAWRRTYVDDLGLDDLDWQEDVFPVNAEMLNWYLGGWSGWKAYRPEGDEATIFSEVASELSYGTKPVPEHHLKGLVALARRGDQMLGEEFFILLRNRHRVAVLEGTHRMAALTLAINTGWKTPDYINAISTEVSDEVFKRFVTDRPSKRGDDN